MLTGIFLKPEKARATGSSPQFRSFLHKVMAASMALWHSFEFVWLVYLSFAFVVNHNMNKMSLNTLSYSKTFQSQVFRGHLAVCYSFLLSLYCVRCRTCVDLKLETYDIFTTVKVNSVAWVGDIEKNRRQIYSVSASLLNINWGCWSDSCRVRNST